MTRFDRRLPLVLTLLLIGCTVEAASPSKPAVYPPPLPEGGSLFFVGNSFMDWEGRNLPEWVRSLGEADGVDIDVGGAIVPGNLPLSEFLTHPAVKAALASRKYRVWILQGHELEPVDHPEQFKQAVRDFNRAIRAAGGSAVLFMTWEFRWRRFLPELAAAYEVIGRELSIPIIPVGLVYRDCGSAPPGSRGAFFLTASREHPDGDLHPNAYGMAASTYATFAIVTGRNPRGKPFPAADATIDAEMLKFISEAAWANAASRLRDSPQER